MNALVAGPTAERELERAVLSILPGTFDPAAVIAEHGGTGIQGARERLTQLLVPLKTVEPKLDGTEAKAVRDNLKVIGAKVRPDFSNDQARAWLSALVIALSDLPAGCVQRATLDAMHVPFSFPNEVEAKVRTLAERERRHVERGIARLDLLQRELIRMRQPPVPQLEHKPLDTEEVHRLQRGPMGTELIRLGLAMGEITPDQLLPPEELEPPAKGEPQ